MTEHTLTVLEEPWRSVVSCSCGWAFEHHDRQVAESRHAQHVGIEAARKALRKETAAE